MGNSWSSRSECGRPKWWFSPSETSSSESASAGSPKRQKRIADHEWEVLIPGLPDEIALQVLARVSRSQHPVMKLVNSSWNRVMNCSEIYEVRQELGVTEQWLYVLMKDKEDEVVWFSMEPRTAEWRRLPKMPIAAFEPDTLVKENALGWNLWDVSSNAITGLFKAILRRKDSGERIPFFGCSAAEAGGYLYVLGGFSKGISISSVLRYDPRRNTWTSVASMGTPRAYCKTGVLHGKLYAVGGVNRSRNGLTPLQSAEVYDPSTDTWSPIPNMPFRGANVLPAPFMSDVLKPIATGMAVFQGKLWVPQSLYSWPFFMDLNGEVYDPVDMSWSDMPGGMGYGWPARQAGMKLSAVVNGRLYALDPVCTSLDGGCKLEVYDSEEESWQVAVKGVPVFLDITGDSESPYLLGSLDGSLLLVIKDKRDNVAVLRTDVDSQADTWEWRTVAVENFGRVELVACQVVDI